MPLVYLSVTDRKNVLTLGLAVLLGASLITLRIFSLQHNYVHDYAGTQESVKVVGVVQSDVTQTPARVFGSHSLPPRYMSTLRSESIFTSSHSFRSRTSLTISSIKPFPFVPGDEIECTGKLLPSKNPKVAALLSARNQCALVHSAQGLWKITAQIRAALREQADRISGDAGALIPGMILGDTTSQSTAFASAMRRVGLTHLTAVSGENFAIVAAFLLWILQWVLKSMKARIVATSVFLVCFLFLVRPSPSVLRAAVMTAALLVARARGRRSSALASLGLAISTLLLIDPFQSLDPGFALSVSATAGILLLAPRLTARWEPVVGRLAGSIAIPAAATLACTPIILAISGQFSLVSIPANLIVAPVVAPITVLGLIAALVAPLVPSLSHLLLVIASPCSQWIAWVAKNFSKFPVLSVSANIFSISLLSLITLAVATKRWSVVITSITILSLALWSPWATWPMTNWVFANCNVGQGDASVINLGKHHAIVIDVGPSPSLIDSCLRQLDIQEITLLVLTHFHADHVQGLEGAMHRRTIGSVWLTNLNRPILESTMVMNKLTRIPHHVVNAGMTVNLLRLSNGLHRGYISVIWPSAEAKNFAILPGDGSAINNSSIALDIEIDGLRIFEGADIEPPVQEAVLATGRVKRVQIFKVCHHGSAYQYLPFLRQLHPEVAVISVGAGNSYGHPAASTVTALRREHAQVLRTDQDGAIAIDNSLKIRVLKRDWWRFSWG